MIASQQPLVTRRRALAFVGATAAVAASPALAQHPATVRIGSTLDDAVTPILYGLHAGIFSDLGLDVQLQSYRSGAVLTSAVVGGALDAGKSSLLALIAAHARGVPVKIVAGAAQYSTETPTSATIVLKDSPIKTATDLEGKTVASSALKALDQISVSAWVDQHGGKSSNIQFVELPNAAMIEAVEQGRIAAATPSNPALAEAVASGKCRIFAKTFDAIAKHFLIAAWFCTVQYIAQNTDVVRRFADGVRRSSLYTNAHHADTVQLLADFTHIPSDVIAKMNRLNNATSVDPKAIQPAIDAAVRYGLIEKPFPPDELIAKL